MSREIKFRAWDKKSNEMLSWFLLCQSAFNNGEASLMYNVFTAPKLSDDKGYELMQFTGLLDKNGKEIYEKDIINVPYNRIGKIKVMWNNEKGKWNIGDYDLKKIEVIGNIYENPELIK